MASKATVGSLRVMLGLDSAQFTAGLTKAQIGLQKFGSIAKAGALAVGAAMITAGGAVAVAMRSMIDEADKMSKMSQAIGVPIEELSRLKYAAQLADVDLDMLGKSLKRLSAGMLDASESGTGTAAKAFTALGVSVKDAEGKMRPATGVIEDLAGKFARMPNGVEKTALAMRIFGKSGADMIPLLNAGSDGLAEMYKEAEELGIVLDTETGLAAEAFNDNLTRMGVIKDGIITKITAGMLPSLESLSSAMVAATKTSGLMNAIGATLGWTLKALATAAVTAGGFFVALARDIALAATVSAKWARGDFAGAATSLLAGNVQREKTLAGILAINRAIWSAPSGAGARPPAAAGLELIDTATNRAARSTRQLSDEQKDLAQLMKDGERTYEQTRTPMEIYQARLVELGRQLDANAIKQDTFNRAIIDARKAFESSDPSTQMWRRTGDAIRDAAAKTREDAKERRADALKLAQETEEDLRQATHDGITDGLYAAADGNLGQYLASRLKAALIDNLASALTDMLRGPKGGTGGGGAVGWLSAAGSMLKQFSRGIPGFANGVENFGGGLAYVHKGEVLTNLAKGTSVIPASDVRAGGSGQPIIFDLTGAVMTADLVAQMNQIGAKAQVGAVRQSTDIVRRSSAGMQQRQRRLGTV